MHRTASCVLCATAWDITDRPPEHGGGTAFYSSHGTDFMFLVAESSPPPSSDTLGRSPWKLNPSDEIANSYRLAAVGRTGVHLLRPHYRKPSALAIHDPHCNSDGVRIFSAIPMAMVMSASLASLRLPGTDSHAVLQDALREALQATSSGKVKRKADHELGIHYTGANDDTGKPLGTIGVVMSPTGGRAVWRFGDRPRDPVDIAAGRRWKLPAKP
jgi:hypothetical protein